jgi:hypothetical protein
MFLNEYSIVKLVLLALKFYFNLLNVILIQLYKKKEARGMGKSIRANIPPPTCEKSGLELCLAQDADPLGNLAARQGQAS